MGVSSILQPAVFDSGGTVSSAVYVGHGRVTQIDIPNPWADLGSPATLTFQGSSDGVNYFDLYDVLGNEITVVVANPGLTIVLPDGMLNALWLVVRSGPGANPIVQTDGATLQITIRKFPVT